MPENFPFVCACLDRCSSPLTTSSSDSNSLYQMRRSYSCHAIFHVSIAAVILFPDSFGLLPVAYRPQLTIQDSVTPWRRIRIRSSTRDFSMRKSRRGRSSALIRIGPRRIFADRMPDWCGEGVAPGTSPVAHRSHPISLQLRQIYTRCWDTIDCKMLLFQL